MVLPLNSGRCLTNEWMVNLGRGWLQMVPLPQIVTVSSLSFSKNFFFFNFWPYQAACRILVPMRLGTPCPSSESMELAVGHPGTLSPPLCVSSTSWVEHNSRVDVDVCLCQHHSISPPSYYLAYSRCPIPIVEYLNTSH